MWVVFFFFFKQKTAYEIYQCDWSSDVCSSDLLTFAGSTRPPSDPSFTISPSSGLVGGDVVAVELTDLRGADGEYLIQQCVDVQGGSACQTVDSGTTIDGTISSTVTVSREVSTGDGSAGDCAEAARRCYLRVETEYQEVERLPIDFEEAG